MTADDREQRRGPLDDETPGSQGEIEAGSEGDFDGPPPGELEHPDEAGQDEPPTS